MNNNQELNNRQFTNVNNDQISNQYVEQPINNWGQQPKVEGMPMQGQNNGGMYPNQVMGQNPQGFNQPNMQGMPQQGINNTVQQPNQQIQIPPERVDLQMSGNQINAIPVKANMNPINGFDYSQNCPVLQIKNLHKTFKTNNNKVLNGVDLTINRGDIYGLIGLNGSGKTTLFKSILGINTYTCDGISLFGSQSLQQFQYNQQYIGFFVTNYFMLNKTAYQNLEYYARLKNIFNHDEIIHLLRQVGLEGVDTPVSGYSLGMRQRLGIATAFLGNPALIILDEPANGLDPDAMKSIRELIKYYNQKYNTTFLVSSHYLKSLSEICNRFGRLEHGKITGEITKEELSTSSDNVNVSLTKEQFNLIKENLAELGIDQEELNLDENALLEFLNNGGKHE